MVLLLLTRDARRRAGARAGGTARAGGVAPRPPFGRSPSSCWCWWPPARSRRRWRCDGWDRSSRRCRNWRRWDRRYPWTPGVVLWMLAVAGAAWVIVCLGLLPMTAVRPPALPGAPDPRVTGRGGRQAALVAAQVAVSGVLVVAAGLLLRSAHGVASTPPGFVPRDILVAQLHTAGYSAAEGHVFYRRLLDELRTGGLVTSAALGWHTPLSVFQLSVAVEIRGPRWRSRGTWSRGTISARWASPCWRAGSSPRTIVPSLRPSRWSIARWRSVSGPAARRSGACSRSRGAAGSGP